MLGIAGVMPEVLYSSVKISICRGRNVISIVVETNRVYTYIVPSI